MKVELNVDNMASYTVTLSCSVLLCSSLKWSNTVQDPDRIGSLHARFYNTQEEPDSGPSKTFLRDFFFGGKK